VTDLSSSLDEDDLIAVTSRDFEFAQRLFGELNRVVLSNFNEDDVREEKTTSIEDAAASAAVNPASTTSVDVDDVPAGEK
jgi:hypothetical protein